MVHTIRATLMFRAPAPLRWSEDLSESFVYSSVYYVPDWATRVICCFRCSEENGDEVLYRSSQQ